MGRIRVPQLETDRLLLRGWERKDAHALYEYAKNPNVGPAAGWKPHESVRESRTIIDQLFRTNTTWAIVHKATGRIIGSIGLEPDKLRTNIRSRELGYSLSEDYWGEGIMTEAAQRIISYAFDEMSLIILMIRTSTTNHRSQRVIEKCGFKYEGTLRQAYKIYDGTLRDTMVFSMTREEYEAGGPTAGQAGGATVDQAGGATASKC